MGTQAATLFVEQADEKGLGFASTDIQSVAWMDFNGDGWQDLWVTGHNMSTKYYRSKLLLNNEGGKFTDIWPLLHNSTFATDAHGSYWADWDNDGDQDLFVVAGGRAGRGGNGDPSLLFVQEQGVLLEKAAGLGLAYPLGRGRLGLWFDENSDGKLDMFTTNTARFDGRPSRNQLFLQQKKSFEAQQSHSKRVDLAATHQLFLSKAEFPETIALRATASSDADRLSLWMARVSKRVVTGDFDGDAELDYLVYWPTAIAAETCHVPSKKTGAVLAYVPKIVSEGNRVFEFTSNGPVKLNSKKSPILKNFIGASDTPEDFGSRILSSFDTRYHSENAVELGVKNGMRITYDPTTKLWRVIVHQASESANTVQFVLTPMAAGVTIKSQTKVCQHQEGKPAFIVNGHDMKQHPLNIKGFDLHLFAHSIVAGDFDNDSDVDLYVARATPVQDLPDYLFENDGAGHFYAMPVGADDAYAADGLFVRELIPGPHMAVADYNNDGFLDVFLGGSHYYSWLDNPRLIAGLPNRLLTNQGNKNHWSQLHLVGTSSNRDAIGARVEVSAGNKRQLQYQTGGEDSFQQHSKVLHFGLGKSTRLDSIEIFWPSGKKSSLSNVDVDKQLTITEP